MITFLWWLLGGFEAPHPEIQFSAAVAQACAITGSTSQAVELYLDVAPVCTLTFESHVLET